MKLVLPATLSFPPADDFPPGWDHAALRLEHAAARIERGYVLRAPEGETRFTFFARCNVDSAELWAVFEDLVSRLPDPVGTLLGMKDEDPQPFPYAPRAEVLPVLRLFHRELTCDPFLQVGLTHQARGAHEEVFIAPAKYLQVWGSDLAAFRAAMASFGLPEIPDLRFIDEFPLTSRALQAIDPSALHFEDVFESLAERLAALEDDEPEAEG